MRNVSGEHDIRGFSSKLTLRDVEGPIRAKTFSGPLEITVAGTTPPSELDLDTFSGDIDVRLPENTAGDVRFRSFSGDLTSDLPLTLHGTNRRRLDAQMNPDAGPGARTTSLKLHTFSGDVRIRR